MLVGLNCIDVAIFERAVRESDAGGPLIEQYLAFDELTAVVSQENGTPAEIQYPSLKSRLVDNVFVRTIVCVHLAPRISVHSSVCLLYTSPSPRD